MRILHVSTRYPPGPGGVERHVRELAVRQRAKGHDVRILTSDLWTEIPWERLPPEEVQRTSTPDGIPIHRHRARALAGDLHYPFLPGLSRDIQKSAPDVVHVHTYGTYQGFSALAAERFSGIPYILTAHYHPTWSIWGGPGRKRLRRVYDHFLAGPVLRHASMVVVQTPEEERLLREVVDPLPPVAMIPPGYTPLPAPSDPPDDFSTRYGIRGPFLLFTGRIASNKGLLPFLEAFALLAPRSPDLSVVMVGEDGGSRAEVLHRAEDLGLSQRVRLVGFVPEERVLASAYAQASVFVLPSEYEAFGLVLLEAMAQGTPVVSTRVGGIPELVEDGQNGLLVPPGDPRALSEALESILSDPSLRERLGRSGREVTVPRFTWERVVEALEPVYEHARGRDGRG